jgi:LPXTG-site transpeptidase (sortase) family protein
LPTKVYFSPAYYQSQADENQDPVVISGLDYTKASSWFLAVFELLTHPDYRPPKLPDYYQISIPSLGIVDANVALKDEDLTKSLVHFPQTALPGQLGSPVIFGHSTIPTFYKKDQYKTIFSNLPKVKIGSDILVNFNGQEYTYRIQKTYEVKPNELWVLRQSF